MLSPSGNAGYWGCLSLQFPPVSGNLSTLLKELELKPLESVLQNSSVLCLSLDHQEKICDICGGGFMQLCVFWCEHAAFQK